MASKNSCPGCTDESDSEEEGKDHIQVIQCPYSPSTIEPEYEETQNKVCCMRNADAKEQDQPPPGFTARISVNIGNQACDKTGVCSSNQLPRQGKSNTNLQQTKLNLVAQNDTHQCPPGSCCANDGTEHPSKPNQSMQGSKKLSSQGVIHRKQDISLTKKSSQRNISNEVTSLININAAQNVTADAEAPCCANAYTKLKPEPPLPPKGISATSRPGYIVNKETPDHDHVPQTSQCMAGGSGCMHGIASIMGQNPVTSTVKDQSRDRNSTCCCKGGKSKTITRLEEGTICDSVKCLANHKKDCPCIYPPGYSQFTCAGNITGNCKCGQLR
ncbi:unnamed protein product [Leptosia nina]|uniref:Uncharacterized protein n=1 Tax=Leptosia nina TaxID=320188 RepID=A0AAV1JYM6_9NEOP